jgi:hypothetical protein
MEVTELFSEGLEIFKKNWIIAVPLVVVEIIVGILALAVMGSMVASSGMMGVSGFEPNLAAFGALMGAAFLFGIISGILKLIAYGMTYVMADDATSGTANLNSGLQKTLGSVVNLLITSILLGVIVFIGMIFLVLPGMIAAFLLMFSIILVMLENKGPVEALQGSFELVKANLSDTIVFAVIALVILIIAGIIGGILGPLSPIISGAATAYILMVQLLLYKELRK